MARRAGGAGAGASSWRPQAKRRRGASERTKLREREREKYAPAVERARKLVPSKNKRFAEFARVVALAPRALIAEFDLDPDLDSESDSEGEGGDEEGFFGEGGFLGSDYDSDDNSTAAQVHRFFAKVEGLGIDLGARGAHSLGGPRRTGTVIWIRH